MDAYTSFASCYDLYMDNVPYDQWTDNVLSLLEKHGCPNTLMCELGCGTGQMTRRFFDKGYDLIGIDMSYEMLAEAMSSSDPGILYLCQDMREFELYGTVGSVVSLCDSVNYLTSFEDLVTTFSLVNNYLDPAGLFIFDVNTVFKYETILGDNTFAENREEGSFIWENEYDPEARDNFYYLTLYMENEEGSFDRFEEQHQQHAFTLEEIKAALEKAGLSFVDVIDVDTMEGITETTERMYIVARECMK